MTGHASGSFSILSVCTGNVFRSRIAEHHLRVGLAERLGPSGGGFVVASAGTGVTPGRPVHPSEASALARVGMPPDARPSRLLAAVDVEFADLVLCADRSHRSGVLELVPSAMGRTFLLREFARVAAAAARLADDDRLASGDGLVRARAVVSAANAFRGYAVADEPDDIADPWGEADAVLSSAADLVREAVPRVLDVLVGGVDHDGARRPGPG